MIGNCSSRASTLQRPHDIFIDPRVSRQPHHDDAFFNELLSGWHLVHATLGVRASPSFPCGWTDSQDRMDQEERALIA